MSLKGDELPLCPKQAGVVNGGQIGLVEAVHGFVDSVIDPGFERHHGAFDGLFYEGPLLAAEASQDIGHNVLPFRGPAHAEAEPRKVVAVQAVDD